MLHTTLAPTSGIASSPRIQTGPVVGVRSTRIYCRPLCRPGRAPKPENCVPFLDAALARLAGFRPCKQCAPDVIERLQPARPKETIRYGLGPTTIGQVFVALSDRGIRGLYLLDDADPAPGLARVAKDFPGCPVLSDPVAVAPLLPRLSAFLAGADDCSDLAIDLSGGTAFQRLVWEALRTIPRGSTRTYEQLAQTLGRSGAARAVGTACGANPVSLLVPCHRVVRTGGGLGGYYWGLDRKRALLDLERTPAVLSS